MVDVVPIKWAEPQVWPTMGSNNTTFKKAKERESMMRVRCPTSPVTLTTVKPIDAHQPQKEGMWVGAPVQENGPFVVANFVTI